MNDATDELIGKYQKLLDKVQKESQDNTFFLKLIKKSITELDVKKRG